MFELDPRLEADSHAVTQWPLCQVRLMDDARYPWLILVPRRASAVEPFDLDEVDQTQLWQEANRAGAILKTETGAAKINIAAIGNIVSQLHIHVIARKPGDAAWPGPVWGQGQAERLDHAALAETLTGLRAKLIAPQDNAPQDSTQ
ncbi:HIT domain-containing protein [Rhodospirillum sp. A1_3_36]|uniref:HIT domain-containing protein n=1 Tax=Rhodospirillum sp. A1_3_36 TaxID=3391666 RepID=UPI0039A5B5DB